MYTKTIAEFKRLGGILEMKKAIFILVRGEVR